MSAIWYCILKLQETLSGYKKVIPQQYRAIKTIKKRHFQLQIFMQILRADSERTTAKEDQVQESVNDHKSTKKTFS